MQAAKGSQVAIIGVGEAPESETEGDTNDLTLSPSQVQCQNSPLLSLHTNIL